MGDRGKDRETGREREQGGRGEILPLTLRPAPSRASSIPCSPQGPLHPLHHSPLLDSGSTLWSFLVCWEGGAFGKWVVAS